MDPAVFYDPTVFDPYRWVTTAADTNGGDHGGGAKEGEGMWEKDKTLDKYFVAFGRGARSCVGHWLAWSELYICTAAVASRFDFELVDTDERHVVAARDFFTPYAAVGFETGVQARVNAVLG